ncbi:MAG: type III pantothenate kinase [Muribaculaceae bacterium]|nr:type III pantothenate kinase [Muribaculaceae bacterium]
MILAIDLGNTLAKGVLIEEQPTDLRFCAPDLPDLLQIVESTGEDIEGIVFCSVRRDSGEMELLSRYSALKPGGRVVKVDGDSPLPIRLDYLPAGSLGADRIAAAVGAWHLFGERCVVADAGTALTVDVVEPSAGDTVDSPGVFAGGTISPGLRLRFESLGRHTDLLPLLEAQGMVGVLGNTTAEAIRAGVIGGAASEIEGIWRHIQSEKGHCRLVITGGDGPLLAEILLDRGIESSIVSDLVFIGLAAIFEFRQLQ